MRLTLIIVGQNRLLTIFVNFGRDIILFYFVVKIFGLISAVIWANLYLCGQFFSSTFNQPRFWRVKFCFYWSQIFIMGIQVLFYFIFQGSLQQIKLNTLKLKFFKAYKFFSLGSSAQMPAISM